MVSIIVAGVVLLAGFFVVTRLMSGENRENRRPQQDSAGSGYASTDGGYSGTSDPDKSDDSIDDGGSGDSGGGDSGGGDSGGGGDGGGGGD